MKTGKFISILFYENLKVFDTAGLYVFLKNIVHSQT